MALHPFIDRWIADFHALLAPLKAKLRDFKGANLRMARWHFERGNFDDAILRYRMVIWRDPKNVEAWAGLGEAQLSAGKREEAMKSLAQAVRFAPGHARALQLLERAKQPPEQAKSA